jgi:hypothetical protein
MGYSLRIPAAQSQGMAGTGRNGPVQTLGVGKGYIRTSGPLAMGHGLLQPISHLFYQTHYFLQKLRLIS